SGQRDLPGLSALRGDPGTAAGGRRAPSARATDRVQQASAAVEAPGLSRVGNADDHIRGRLRRTARGPCRGPEDLHGRSVRARRSDRGGPRRRGPARSVACRRAAGGGAAVRPADQHRIAARPLPGGAGLAERAAVTVVMPFAGGPAEAERALAALRAIERGHDDRLVLVDNNPDRVVATQADVEVVHAARERSSYHARNAGARSAGTEWILFVDADCRPDPGILETYFEPPPGPGVGALAGAVRADCRQEALLARYARSRCYLSQQELLEDPYRPHAVTANLLVRQRAWASVGGFAEGVRSGGDSDFCWRLADAGWTLEDRLRAGVAHAHRERLAPFLRVAAPLRAVAASVRWLAAGERERGAFRALDAAVGIADVVGEQLGNRARLDP